MTETIEHGRWWLSDSIKPAPVWHGAMSEGSR